jgi:hypothetical protein
MAGIAGVSVVFARRHIVIMSGILGLISPSSHVSSHVWRCRRREEIGRKYQHSHTQGGRVYGKEEKPIDDARCAINAAITR